MTSPAQAAADIIKARITFGPAETAVLLGRGFQGVADLAENPVAIPYSELPGFPQVSGGEVIICHIDGVPALILKGRPSFYETGDPSLMLSPVETLTHLGVRAILSPGFVTSVRADVLPGSLVLITDHINFSGMNPLIGVPSGIGVNLNDAYDKRLQRKVNYAASGASLALHEGVLMWCSGPSYETPAEVKMAKALGADVIGWTIAPEAILARAIEIPFVGVGVTTDLGAGFLGVGAPSSNLTRGPVIAGLISVRRLLRGYVKIKS